ncbi:MAG: type II secretion system F family protein [Pseudomonadota bacterium]
MFTYKAVGRDGKPITGTLEAAGSEVASRQLRAQGLTLLSMEVGAAAGVTGGTAGGTLSRQEVLSFTSELAVLLRAGLPLDRALKVLIEMAATPANEQFLMTLLDAVKGGKSLSQALEQQETGFTSFYISMVRSGEASGKLADALNHLVDYLETAKTNRDTVVSALIYPAILAVVALVSVAFMLGFVVPQFEALFEDMGDALPALTRAVVSGADFLAAWGWLLLVLVIAAVFYLRHWASTAEGRASLHRRTLATPVLGQIVFEFEVSKFARTTGTLLGSGVSLLKAISIANDTVNNVIIRQALDALPPAVKAGKRISATLEETDMFSPLMIQMVRVGEESGNLGSMLLELARVFDQRVQAGVKRGLTLLEPVLILSMGFIIALIIIAILMGILSVNSLAV